MAFPLIDPHGHQMAMLAESSTHQTLTRRATTTTVINYNNDWSHHDYYGYNDDDSGLESYNKSQRTVGSNLGPQPIDPIGETWYREPFPCIPPPPSQPLSSSYTVQVMPLHCVSIPDCNKPPPGLFQYTPPGGFHQSPGQESDSLFSEGSSMSSSRHREEGPSYWDQGSDSAKGSTPFLEDQDSNWRASNQAGAPPTFWIPPELNIIPHPYGIINPELLSATPCRGAPDEVEDCADDSSVFDWDQYKLTEEEVVEVEARAGGRISGDVLENDCKDVVDMEICSIVSDGNNDGERNSCVRPTTTREKEEDAFSESDRLTDSQMLSLLRHLSATNKNNGTNKNICHTIELFLTLLPVQLQSDTVELRKSSMSSTQIQIFDLLHSKAPWVVDEQIIRSMDLLPFILKRILASMELQQQTSAHVPPSSTDQAPSRKSCSDRLHHKRPSPVHRRKRRRHHSPRRSRSPLVRRRGRDRSRSPPRYLTSHRDVTPPRPPPLPRDRASSLTSLTAVPQSPPKRKVFQFEGRGRNIFTRSPEPPRKTTTDPPPRTSSSSHAEGRPDRGHQRVKATVRLPHITAGDDDEEEEEQSTEIKAVKGSGGKVTDQSKQPTKLLTLSFSPMQMKQVEAKWKKSRLESIKRRNRQTSNAMRWKKRTNFMTKKRLANTKAPSLMALSIPPMSVLRQTGRPKPTAMKKSARRRRPPSLLTVKVPLLATAPQPSRINHMRFASSAHVTPLTFAPMATSHRGLLPDPGSQEHLMIIGMKTVSRLGLQSNFH